MILDAISYIFCIGCATFHAINGNIAKTILCCFLAGVSYCIYLRDKKDGDNEGRYN